MTLPASNIVLAGSLLQQVQHSPVLLVSGVLAVFLLLAVVRVVFFTGRQKRHHRHRGRRWREKDEAGPAEQRRRQAGPAESNLGGNARPAAGPERVLEAAVHLIRPCKPAGPSPGKAPPIWRWRLSCCPREKRDGHVRALRVLPGGG